MLIFVSEKIGHYFWRRVYGKYHVRSRWCGCLVTWFCYQMIGKPGNKTAASSRLDPYMIRDIGLPNKMELLNFCPGIREHKRHSLRPYTTDPEGPCQHYQPAGIQPAICLPGPTVNRNGWIPQRSLRDPGEQWSCVDVPVAHIPPWRFVWIQETYTIASHHPGPHIEDIWRSQVRCC